MVVVDTRNCTGIRGWPPGGSPVLYADRLRNHARACATPVPMQASTSIDRPRALAGQVALITGANTGIGRVTARRLAELGAHVFVACRSAQRAAAVIEEIRAGGGSVEALQIDLADLGSVRACADAFLGRDRPLHLLVNNGGIAGGRGLTASGFELAFGVNHVGHFLLTRLLLERLRRSAPSRIVTVASRAHYRAGGIDWEAVRRPTASLTGWPEYQVSKLANVLFSAELARRLAGSGVTTGAVHPGVVASDIWRSVPWPIRPLIKLRMISSEDGARTTLHCATSAEAATQSGLYYDACRPRTPRERARDETLARELWSRTERWVA